MNLLAFEGHAQEHVALLFQLPRAKTPFATCYDGEQTTNMRDEIDGTEECKVSLRDAAGIEHTVMVRAVNRYHAYGLALAKMKRCSWSNPEHRDLNRMAIELIQTGKRWRRVYVTAAQFEAWLAQRDDRAQRASRLCEDAARQNATPIGILRMECGDSHERACH